MSKRDSRIISFLVCIIITVLGYSLLINPQISKLKTEKSSRNSYQIQLDEMNRKISGIESLKKEVDKLKQDKQSKNKEFSDHLTDYQTDDYLRNIFKSAGITNITSMNIADLAITELTPYKSIYQYPTYPLLGSRSYFDSKNETVPNDTTSANKTQNNTNTNSVIPGTTQLPSYNVKVSFECDLPTLCKVMDEFNKPASYRSIVVNSIQSKSNDGKSVEIDMSVYFAKSFNLEN